MALPRSLRSLLPPCLQQCGLQPQALPVLAHCRTFAAGAGVEPQPVRQSAPAPATQPSPEQARDSRSQAADSEWTEVVEEKSGGVYYWNQKTGETTELGEPRPRTRFHHAGWEGAAASAGPFQDGWREPPGKDLTYFYSVIGTGIGIVVGWATQYMH